MNDYGRIFFALREAAGADWQAYTHHAFPQKMGDGTLPQEAFLHYLRQDYVFLIHFSRAWALAVTKTTAIDEMRLCAGTVHALINGEMKLHVEGCARHGIDEAELGATAESDANLAYTRFVMDAGHGGDLLDLLVALAPCVFGYGEIGARLSQEKSSETYDEWIGAYGAADYQDLCADVGALMDRVAARLIGPDLEASPRWPALCAIFRKASRLEASFWQMGLDRS